MSGLTLETGVIAVVIALNAILLIFRFVRGMILDYQVDRDYYKERGISKLRYAVGYPGLLIHNKIHNNWFTRKKEHRKFYHDTQKRLELLENGSNL